MAAKNKIRIQASILTALLSISLVGCSSDKKYDDLEKRVSFLESKLGVSSENTVPGSTNALIATTTVQADTPFYYLDGMSAKDIANKYISFYQNPPRQGESFEEYYKSFSVEPFITQDTYSPINGSTVLSQWVEMVGYGRHESDFDRTHTIDKIDRNAILRIELVGSTVNMDRTIAYSGDFYSMDVMMYIKDFDTASAVYEELLAWITDNCDYTNITDGRGADVWMASGEDKTPNFTPKTYYIMCLDKVFRTPRLPEYDTRVDGYILEICCHGKVQK